MAVRKHSLVGEQCLWEGCVCSPSGQAASWTPIKSLQSLSGSQELSQIFSAELLSLGTWHTTSSQHGTRVTRITGKNIRGEGDGNIWCGIFLPHLGYLLWEKLTWTWTLDFGHCPFAPLFLLLNSAESTGSPRSDKPPPGYRARKGK